MLADTAEVMAFYDHDPSAETDILVVPKTHVPSFMELDESALLDKMRQVVQELVTKNNLSSGYRLVINGGKYQHVPHLHWHILGGELRKPLP